MTTLEKKLRARLRRLGVHQRDRVLVAVSGGADSTALLDALARWKKSENLFVAHLNHLLRGAESDADEAFVREMAARLVLPSVIARENIAACAAREKQNLEATARRVRYDFLRRAAEASQATVIVTGHTRDDQVETILLRLLRGTSAAGWRGIEAEIALRNSLRLLRPLLDITRAEVLAHCAAYQLTFRHDSSNESAAFTRNRIRHELLPLLETFNPAIHATLVRVAAQISEDDDFLQAEAARWAEGLTEAGALNFQPLLKLHPALRRRVLRHWVQNQRGDLRRISTAHLLSVDNLICQGDGGSYVELPGGWQVERRRNQLKLQPVAR
jgi:tRNA(Ile)-lysidine synthase